VIKIRFSKFNFSQFARSSRLFLIFLGLICFQNYKSQIPLTIKVKKLPGDIYFFQKGESSDTITKNQHDLFYLLVPDSVKKNISVLVENGQFVITENDSIVKLNYMQGLKYESLYVKPDILNPTLNTSPKKKNNTLQKNNDHVKREFKTFINGTSVYQLNKILIQLYNKKTGKIFLENIFYYKN